MIRESGLEGRGFVAARVEREMRRRGRRGRCIFGLGWG